MEFTSCINHLTERLLLPLPGEDAQYKMAPLKRKSRVKKYSALPNAKHSSVLLLLFPENNNTNLVLIRRAIDNSHHSGQIALPGGAVESHDVNLKATALRETEEEIGVELSKIEVIGSLTKLFIPVSNYWVHPFVGSVNHIPEFIPDSKEVDEVITCDLNYFRKTEIIKQHEFETKTGFKIPAPYYDLQSDKLWGATAMILSEFLELLENKQ